MVKKIRSGKVLGILIVSPFLLCVNFCRKKAVPRNFHLAGRRRLPFIGVILAQIDLTHNTLWTLSPVLRKILHKRPGTSGQHCCNSPGSPLRGAEFLSKGSDHPDTPHRKWNFTRFICYFSRTVQFYVYILVHSANRQNAQEYV